MKTRARWRWSALTFLCPFALFCQPCGEAWADAWTPPGVRLRGPLHEAFAAPLEGAGKPGDVVKRRPARSPDERPAPVKPSSPRAIWISGYWGWDPAENDFVWIPGVWRTPPPGMQWVPGYWSSHDDGCRWVRGFWYPIDRGKLSYLPSPPAERWQTSKAPFEEDEFRVPGHWSFHDGEYHWAAGFAAAHRQGWVWIASHWVWTPRGALFAPGYWDYVLTKRGLAFAPLPRGAVARIVNGLDRAFSPTVALNLAELPEAMFIASGQGHYYFGDYFDTDLRDAPRPWYEADARGGFDANFVYECWQRRGQPDWRQALGERYRRRRADAASRPAVEFNVAGQLKPGGLSLGLSVAALGRSPEARRTLAPLPPELARQAAENALVVKSVAERRANTEAAPAEATETSLTLKLPPPAAPLDRQRRVPQLPSATAGQYVPGVSGRETPGAANRGLPGTSGRTLPGVDVRVPGATAPGVLPGADTGVGRR